VVARYLVKYIILRGPTGSKTIVKQIAVALLTLNSNRSFALSKPISPAIKRAGVILLFILLILAEIFRVYFVMPFSGSQQSETIDIAYWLGRHINLIRFLIGIVLLIALVRVWRRGKAWERICLSLAVLSFIPVYLLFNFRFEADSIFHKPSRISFIPAASSEDKTKLVIGIVVNGEAKAYPIQLIGYHHQVEDIIGNEPVIVTYCTVCRTGRVYSSMVNGRRETFRLVGMDHFNAVFEDQTTKSWWQQANGEAIAGPLKGSSLTEIPSAQFTVDSWLRQYPGSLVMAPDPIYDDRYFKLEDYDRGTMQSSLVKRDYTAWAPKAWVVGVKNENVSMAYDWNDLVRERVIQDSLQSMPILLAMESDTTSFHVYDRRINGSVLQFSSQIADNCLTDTGTNSVWNMDGLCINGPLKGKQLTRVQAYNEFWHAWQSFHVNPKQYKPLQ